MCATLCSTLCDHMNCSPPDSSVLGISQTRILELVESPQMLIPTLLWILVLAILPMAIYFQHFPSGANGKESTPVQETQEMWVWSLGREDPLEKEIAIHSSPLAWEIPWTEELGGLQFMQSQRVGHDWVHTHVYFQVCFLPPPLLSSFCVLLSTAERDIWKLYFLGPIAHLMFGMFSQSKFCCSKAREGQ